MLRRDDDLGPWRDDSLVRALTAPATENELTGRAGALAAFRSAMPSPARRRFAGRVGVTGSAVGVALVLSAGAAAAYTSSLPSPLQREAHAWLGGIGVKAPHPAASAKVQVGPPAAISPNATLAAGGGSRPVAVPAQTAPAGPAGHQRATGTHRSVGTHSHRTPTPIVTPRTPSPTPTPTPPPRTPSPRPVVPGSITISVGAERVAVGGSVLVTGQVATSSGAPVVGRKIVLVSHAAGGSADQVGSATTDSSGSVVLTSPDLTRTTRLRLIAPGSLHSAPLTVVVDPTLTAIVTTGDPSDTVDVLTNGGETGDVVTLEVKTASGWRQAGTTHLDGTARARFDVPAATSQSQHYRLVLPRTAEHGAATTHFTTSPAVASTP